MEKLNLEKEMGTIKELQKYLEDIQNGVDSPVKSSPKKADKKDQKPKKSVDKNDKP